MLKIRTGIIGFGLSGRVFHGSLIKNMTQYVVNAVATSRTEEVRQMFPTARVSTFEEIITSEDIDLVIIATPNSFHAGHAGAALKAKKHVVVEKPFVTNTVEGKKLKELADEMRRKHNVISAVYHNRRWDNDFLTLKRIIKDSLLGKLKYFESHFDRYRPSTSDRWREKNIPGSGILFDLGSHLIDQSLDLFGLPDWIWADIDAQRPGAVTDDYFHMLLGYDDLRVELHSSSYVNGKFPRFALHGEKGSFTKYGFDPQETDLRAGKTYASDGWGGDSETDYGTLFLEENISRIMTIPGSYQDFYSQLAEAISGISETPVSFSEGLDVIRIIESAKRSSIEGKKIYL